MPTPSIRQQFRQLRAEDFHRDDQQLFAVQFFLDRGYWPWWERRFPAFAWMDDAARQAVISLYYRDMQLWAERRQQMLAQIRDSLG